MEAQTSALRYGDKIFFTLAFAQALSPSKAVCVAAAADRVCAVDLPGQDGACS